MSTSSERGGLEEAPPAQDRRDRISRRGGRSSGERGRSFPLFAALSVVSLLAYLAVGQPVRAFLAKASELLDTFLRVVA